MVRGISEIDLLIKARFMNSAPLFQKLRRPLYAFFILSGPLGLVPFAPMPAAVAQVTSASLRGAVLDAKGQPMAGALVQLELGNAQFKKTSETNAAGEFAFNGLRVGGPYTVRASKAGFNDSRQDGIFLKAGSNEAISLSLDGNEVIKITSTRAAPVSQKRYFGENEIRNAPSASGDPKDIVRSSPDVNVDGNSMSIGGANNRFNSVTIDGIRQDDDFGLNGNGYPTQRSPISLQSVAEITVERSPFDVRFGNFLGGNVNVVTKSGTNEFEGSVMTTYSSDALTGKKSKNQTLKSDFSENRLGFTLGGPIIEDKLHFFVSAEGLKATQPNDIGPAGSGEARVAEKVTAADVARAQEISANVYGFNAGTPGESQEEDDLKLLAKVDWTINDAHRFELKYQRSTGSSITTGNVNESRLPLTSSWFKKRDTLDTTSLRLFSDWSNELSSKFELSQKKVVTEQDPLEGNGFMSAEIVTADKGSIFLGPDPARHTNELENESFHVGTELNYLLGDHQITVGYERDTTDVYNLFISGSNGIAKYNSLNDFEARRPASLDYNNAVSLNPRDAAANFTYGVNALYLQDEYRINSQWTARYGLRGEFYEASRSIARNEIFAGRHGFDNTATVDGKEVLLPRFGLSYKPSEKTSFRTGLGLYAGGTPNVWISNTYTNTGVTIDNERTDAALSNAAEGFDGRNIPDAIRERLEAGQGNVDALDPDFQIPQSWKFSLGSNHRFDLPYVADNVVLDFDYTYSKVRQALTWKDLRRNLASLPNNQPTAVGPDGRALYDTTPGNRTDGGYNPSRGYDLLLTNTDKGYGHTASLSLSKNFSSGLSLSTAYAWQRVFEVNPGVASTASSNYSQIAVGKDPNDLELTRSTFERTHRFLLTAGYSHDFAERLPTTFNIFFERRSGQPYSYTFGGNKDTVAALFGESSDFQRNSRSLFYVPKGDGSDVILDGIDEEQFNSFLKKRKLDKYRGKIAPRNAFTSNWVDVVDARISQELPTKSDTQKARLILDIKNVPNFLNKKWGQNRQADFPYMNRVVDVDYDAASGRYRYSNFNDKDAESVRLRQSVWQMQVGAVYEF